MDIRITPSKISGELSAIPSKSHAHRLFICAAFSDAPTDFILSDTNIDIDTTLNALTCLGAKIIYNKPNLRIYPIKSLQSNVTIDCKESGSTLRFMLPIVAALGISAKFEGSGRLPQRPLHTILDIFKQNNVTYSKETLPLNISGKLDVKEIAIDGSISSQYVTGLLLATPLLKSSLKITLLSPLQSKPYVQLTIATMKQFGVHVQETENGYYVASNQHYHTINSAVSIEGDWSNVAFFLAAGAIDGPITMKGLDFTSQQGDRLICNYLSDFGANLYLRSGNIHIATDHLQATNIDVSNTPDLLPILAVIAACATSGTTMLSNAARLRLKESDRLESTANMLASVGIKCEIGRDYLSIKGGQTFKNGIVDAYNDHRIAMSAAIIGSCLVPDYLDIIGADAVNKSYPSFFDDLLSLGGISHELPIR